MVYQVRNETSQRDLFYVELDEDPLAPVPLLQTPYNEGAPQLSPDARYVAYVSDQSGRNEVYVSEFPGGAERVAVSVDGGLHPRWGPRGDELFYLEGRRLMTVSVRTTPTLSAEAPRPLFTADDASVTFDTNGLFDAPPYDVHPDGDRFLVVRTVFDDDRRPGIVVVENWLREFRVTE